MACRIPFVKQKIELRKGLFGLPMPGYCPIVGVKTYCVGKETGWFGGICMDRAKEMSSGTGSTIDIPRNIHGHTDYDDKGGVAGCVAGDGRYKVVFCNWEWGEFSVGELVTSGTYNSGVACWLNAATQELLLAFFSGSASWNCRIDFWVVPYGGGALDFDSGAKVFTLYDYRFMNAAGGWLFMTSPADSMLIEAINLADALEAVKQGTDIPSKSIYCKDSVDSTVHRGLYVQGKFWVANIVDLWVADEAKRYTNAFFTAVVGDWLCVEKGSFADAKLQFIGADRTYEYSFASPLADDVRSLDVCDSFDEVVLLEVIGEDAGGILQTYVGSDASYPCIPIPEMVVTQVSPDTEQVGFVDFVDDHTIGVHEGTAISVESTGTVTARQPEGCFSES